MMQRRLDFLDDWKNSYQIAVRIPFGGNTTTKLIINKITQL